MWLHRTLESVAAFEVLRRRQVRCVMLQVASWSDNQDGNSVFVGAGLHGDLPVTGCLHNSAYSPGGASGSQHAASIPKHEKAGPCRSVDLIEVSVN